MLKLFNYKYWINVEIKFRLQLFSLKINKEYLNITI